MLSEDFDKKIREAADHHHPAYDEKAWSGMKKLLDKHLPEEKDDRRRYFFFLLLFLLLGGGAAWYFLGTGSGGRKNQEVTSLQTSPADKVGNPTAGVDVTTSSSAPDATGERTGDNKFDNDSPSDELNISAEDNEHDKPVRFPGGTVAKTPAYAPGGITKTGKPGRLKSGNTYRDKQPSDKRANPVVADKRLVKTEAPVEKQDPPPALAKKTGDPSANKDIAGVPVNPTEAALPAAPDPGNKNVDKNAAAESKQRPADATRNEEKKTGDQIIAKSKKKPAPKRSTFFFAVSAGPDVSYTGNDKLGKMKLLGGAGIGYTYKDRFTLRSGFYTGRKVYTSSPGEYNPPAIFYTYYPNLQKVEADCRVYEIPLLLSYHFGSRKKHGWFATAGISTIIMKEETYDYYYKYTPSGPTVHRQYSMYNENKHFFSVMTLSAGYQRSLGKRVSVMAEPYLKLPMSGVGYGKVKLNSAGVLFSLSVKPFGRTDNK